MADMKPKTFEMELNAYVLGNWAYIRLHHLLDNELCNRENIDPEMVDEAQTVLQFKKAIAHKADFLLIRLRYENPDSEKVEG